MRIVSLLPSTTEILFDLGAGDDVVGVTFECDHPVEARSRTIVSTSAMPEGLTPARDRRVRGRRDAPRARTSTTSTRARWPAWTPTSWSPRTSARSARSTSRWSTTRSPTSAAPPRCSPSTRTPSTRCSPRSARSARPPAPRPGRTPWSASLRARLDDVVRRTAGRPRPRALVLEWTDPPFAPGHWVPEMVELGRRRVRCSARRARSRSGSPGTRSARRGPEVVVCAPCGYGLEQSPRAGRRAGRRGRAARRRRGVGRRRQRVVRAARTRGWSTASRRSPGSCTRTSSAPPPIAARVR